MSYFTGTGTLTITFMKKSYPIVLPTIIQSQAEWKAEWKAC